MNRSKDKLNFSDVTCRQVLFVDRNPILDTFNLAGAIGSHALGFKEILKLKQH